MVAEHTRPNNRAFGGGKRYTRLESALRNAQRHGTDRESKQADERKPIQGALVMQAAGHAGAKAPRIRFGDKDLLDREIMTACPHQPTDLPSVLQDGRLRGGEV